MFNTLFLILKAQLTDQKKAKIIVEGVEIYFSIQEDHQIWNLSSKIYVPTPEMTEDLKELVHGISDMKTKKNQSLKFIEKSGVVVFSMKAPLAMNIVDFKQLIKVYMESYDLWKSVMDDLVESEGLVLTN